MHFLIWYILPCVEMYTVVLGPVPVPAVTEEVEAFLYIGPHYSLPLDVDVIRVLPSQTHPPQHRVPAETLTTPWK